MPTVDPSGSSSNWSVPVMPQSVPLPNSLPNAPPFLPTFLERPGDAPLATPVQLSGTLPSPIALSADARTNPTVDRAAIPEPNPPADEPSPRPSGSRLRLPVSLPLRVRRLAGEVDDANVAAEREFGALACVWNSLAGSMPFRSFEWAESWWRHYREPGWQTYLLKVEDAAGQLVGIAPWYLSRSPIAGRAIRFLGSGEACSEYQSILARPGHEAVVATACRNGLPAKGPAIGIFCYWRLRRPTIRRPRRLPKTSADTDTSSINRPACPAGDASCRRRGTNSCAVCRNCAASASGN